MEIKQKPKPKKKKQISSSIRTARISMYITGHNTAYSCSNNLCSNPPDNQQQMDVFNWQGLQHV